MCLGIMIASIYNARDSHELARRLHESQPKSEQHQIKNSTKEGSLNQTMSNSSLLSSSSVEDCDVETSQSIQDGIASMIETSTNDFAATAGAVQSDLIVVTETTQLEITPTIEALQHDIATTTETIQNGIVATAKKLQLDVSAMAETIQQLQREIAAMSEMLHNGIVIPAKTTQNEDERVD